MPDFETKDSGVREEFDTGMVRDTVSGKPRFDLISPEHIPFDDQMLTRWAKLMERGSKKYGERNWEKAATDKERQRFRDSAFRHFMQWYFECPDEDHAAAVFFNISGKEMVDSRRKLPQVNMPNGWWIAPVDMPQDLTNVSVTTAVQGTSKRLNRVRGHTHS